MKYLSKLIKILVIIFLVAVITVFIFINIDQFSPKNNTLFWTSEEHRKTLGIEIVKLLPEEEQYLHSMIEKVYKASFLYFDTGKDEGFQTVKDLFLPEEYERIKNDIIEAREDEVIWESYRESCKIKIPFEFSEIRFSQPRTYKELEDRIGIMATIPGFSGPVIIDGRGACGGQSHIFIFQKINNEWGIERIRGIDFAPLEYEEKIIIEKIKEGSKK